MPKQVGGVFAIYILTGGVLGFSYDLIHQQFIKARAPVISLVCCPAPTERLPLSRQVTSSMSMGIAGNAKMVLLIAISMVSQQCVELGLGACHATSVFVRSSRSPDPIASTSQIFLEGEPTTTSIVGILVGLVGCFWYSAYKQWEAHQAKAKKTDSVDSEKTGLLRP